MSSTSIKHENDVTTLKTRIQLDLDPVHMERLNRLMELCGIKTNKDLFNVALSLLEWSVNEARSGKAIASVDKSTRSFNEVVMPALSDAAHYRGRELEMLR